MNVRGIVKLIPENRCRIRVVCPCRLPNGEVPSQLGRLIREERLLREHPTLFHLTCDLSLFAVTKICWIPNIEPECVSDQFAVEFYAAEIGNFQGRLDHHTKHSTDANQENPAIANSSLTTSPISALPHCCTAAPLQHTHHRNPHRLSAQPGWAFSDTPYFSPRSAN